MQSFPLSNQLDKGTSVNRAESIPDPEVTAGSQTAALTTILTGPTMQAPATAATTSFDNSTRSSVSQPPPVTLGINFEKPTFPEYAGLTARINTYNNWPNYLDQTPSNMASAGFFHVGMYL